jgi:hypothetical protein
MIRQRKKCSIKLRTHFAAWAKAKNHKFDMPMKKVLAVLYDINRMMGERLVKGLPIMLPHKLGEIQIYKFIHTRKNLKYGKLSSTGVTEYFPLAFEESYAPKILWRKHLGKYSNKERVPFLGNYKFKLVSTWNKPLFEAITKDYNRFLDV